MAFCRRQQLIYLFGAVLTAIVPLAMLIVFSDFDQMGASMIRVLVRWSTDDVLSISTGAIFALYLLPKKFDFSETQLKTELWTML